MVRRIIACILLLLNFASCRKENLFDCFTSSGKDSRETRVTGSFQDFEVSDKIEVFVLRGSAYNVEIIAARNILKNILTRVENETLKIENRNTCNFVRGYKREIKVFVTVPHIRQVTNLGVGKIIFSDDFVMDTLVARAESSGDIHVNGTFNQLRISSHGNGDMYLSGTANSLYVYSNGTNFIYAGNFRIKDYAFIHNLSLGDCFINADSLNRLECNIQGSGNIYYSGNPPFITDYSDVKISGRLIKE